MNSINNASDSFLEVISMDAISEKGKEYMRQFHCYHCLGLTFLLSWFHRGGIFMMYPFQSS